MQDNMRSKTNFFLSTPSKTSGEVENGMFEKNLGNLYVLLFNDIIFGKREENSPNNQTSLKLLYSTWRILESPIYMGESQRENSGETQRSSRNANRNELRWESENWLLNPTKFTGKTLHYSETSCGEKFGEKITQFWREKNDEEVKRDFRGGIQRGIPRK